MEQMVDWEAKVIVDNAKKLKSAEKKSFMLAYAELPEEIHGYLSQVAKPQKVFHKNFPKEDLDKLKRDNKLDLWQYSGEKASRNPGIFLNIDTPYLSFDGMIAYANLEHMPANMKIEQSIEVIPKNDYIFIKATVVSEIRGKAEGIAVCNNITNFEKDVSTALRKAFNYMGYGRFPVHSTPYGEDLTVQEFRKFKFGEEEEK